MYSLIYLLNNALGIVKECLLSVLVVKQEYIENED